MNAPIEDISKFLAGTLDAEKTDALVQWRQITPENESYFQEMAEVWQSSSITLQKEKEILSVDTEAGLTAVHAKIEALQNKPTKIVKLKPRFNFLAIASGLALFIAAVFTFQYVNSSIEPIEIIASADTGRQVILPDESTIWLEPQAKLSYLESFSSGRNISVEGTIFLEVTHNKDNPFTVQSPRMTTQVLGTSFVVEDKAQDKTAHVTVITGKVKVTASQTKQHVLLTKDMTAVYDDDTKNIQIDQNTKSYNHLYKVTKQLKFYQTTLVELFEQLEKVTNSTIDLENKALSDCPFTGQFDTNDVDIILKRIQPIYNFNIQSKEGTYYISGGSCN